jgi:iron(III) transport system permease protein
MNKRVNPFLLMTLVLIVFIGAILFSFIAPLWTPTTVNWTFFLQYQLQHVIGQTAWLMFGSVFFALLFAVYPAYMMSFYRFRFKKFFEILFILPLALPSYIYGYLYAHMTNVTGFLYDFASYIGFEALVTVTHLRGAMFLFGLSLYPYLYLGIRAFLVKQPQSLIQTAKTLGLNEWQRFYRIFLPILRPVLIGSSVLVMMEVLNDFGLVSYFGLNVISTAIFQLWFNGNDLNAAARLGSIVVILILVFLGGEIFLRKHPKYAYSTTQLKAIRQTPLNGWKKTFFYTYSFFLWFTSLGLPVVQLGRWLVTIDFINAFLLATNPLLNTLMLGTFTAVVIMLLALAVANVTRYQHLRLYRVLSRLLTLGYSLPGVLIAMAIFLFFMPIERWLFNANIDFSFQMTTSIGILLIALVIRYLAIGIQFVESAYQKVGLKFTQASYTLKQGKILTLFRVDMPMMAQSLVAAVLIILIDVFKELPLTLFLRPFNYDTLATRLYQFASDEQLAESSPMMIVLWAITAFVVYGASHLMIKEDAYEFND